MLIFLERGQRSLSSEMIPTAENNYQKRVIDEDTARDYFMQLCLLPK